MFVCHQVTSHLDEVGLDTSGVEQRGRKRHRSLSLSAAEAESAMDVEGSQPATKRARSSSRAPSQKPPQAVGLKDAKQQNHVAKLARKAQKKANQMARAGEADRKTGPKLTKHLLAGKMGLGTKYHR